jgi:hypothetical protein
VVLIRNPNNKGGGHSRDFFALMEDMNSGQILCYSLLKKTSTIIFGQIIYAILY